MLFTVTSLQTTSFNLCFQLKRPRCHKSVLFFYVSVHHRSNWQLFVYTRWGNKWDEYNRGDNKRMFLNVQLAGREEGQSHGDNVVINSVTEQFDIHVVGQHRGDGGVDDSR